MQGQGGKNILPGGCAIGTKPVDLHLKGFAAMGAEINQEHGFIEAKVNGKLRKQDISRLSSVGATENIMMATVLAEDKPLLKMQLLSQK